MSKFARDRHLPNSENSHWDYSEEELISRVLGNFENKVTSYRDGTVLVEISPDGAFSSLRVLEEGDELVGFYKPRREGETPRRSTYVIADKTPAKRVDVVLYRKDVLEEETDPERLKDLTGADWEIISFNASPFEEDKPAPIEPNVFMANHFGSDGGTATNMTPEQFEAQLRESFKYWKDKCFVKPSGE